MFASGAGAGVPLVSKTSCLLAGDVEVEVDSDSSDSMTGNSRIDLAISSSITGFMQFASAFMPVTPQKNGETHQHQY